MKKQLLFLLPLFIISTTSIYAAGGGGTGKDVETKTDSYTKWIEEDVRTIKEMKKLLLHENITTPGGLKLNLGVLPSESLGPVLKSIENKFIGETLKQDKYKFNESYYWEYLGSWLKESCVNWFAFSFMTDKSKTFETLEKAAFIRTFMRLKEKIKEEREKEESAMNMAIAIWRRANSKVKSMDEKLLTDNKDSVVQSITQAMILAQNTTTSKEDASKRSEALLDIMKKQFKFEPMGNIRVGINWGVLVGVVLIVAIAVKKKLSKGASQDEDGDFDLELDEEEDA